MKLTLISIWCSGIRVSKFVNVPDDMIKSDGSTRIPESIYRPIESELIKRARFLAYKSTNIRGVTFTPGG